MLSYFLTYSSPELRHFSYRGTNFCILCCRRLAPGIGYTVTLISASLSFWKRSRWRDRNFLRCKKRWKSLGTRSGLKRGWLKTSQPNSCRRCVDRRAVCGRRIIASILSCCNVARGSPASACVMRFHYFSSICSSLHSMHGLLRVGRVEWETYFVEAPCTF